MNHSKPLARDKMEHTQHLQELAKTKEIRNCCDDNPPKKEKTKTIGFLDKKFWYDKHAWKKAGKNTLNCLIGCSIGDFGMIIYLNIFYPETPIMLIMVLAMTTGLITSIILETVI